jgi:hypothetical protein
VRFLEKSQYSGDSFLTILAVLRMSIDPYLLIPEKILKGYPMSKSIKFVFFFFALSLIAGHAQAFPNQAKTPQGTVEKPPVTKGTVTETMNAAGYTYMCLDHSGQKSWVAIQETPVKVGEEVEIANGMVMKNFTSKTLGRTFDEIIFSQGIVTR